MGYNKCDPRAARTLRDLSATGGMNPFPDVPIVPDLWTWSMAVFSGPVNVAYSHYASSGLMILLPLKVDADSETHLQRFGQSSRFGALAMKCELKDIRNLRVVTCGKFCACQLCRIQESI